MAESNALNVGNGGGAQAAMQAPTLSRTAAAQMAGPQRVQPVDPQGARTMDALLKLGSDILAPHIKAAETEQYLAGLQQAASGQGLQEVIDQQPWYTQIFGPSSASMGARAYTTSMAIAQFGADMERDMPNLAKQGPEALTQRASEHIKGMLTGDPLADAAIMAGYTDQLQPLMKRHAKESYIYQQRQASHAQVGAWDSLFDAYQARATAATKPDGGVSQEDMVAESSRLISSLLPFADQSDESYQKNLTSAIVGAARKGNFHAVSLLEKEGVFKALTPEEQGQLQGALRAAGRESLNKAMPTFAMDVAMLVNDTAQDPRGIVDRVAKLNERAAVATGVSTEYAQLIPSSTVDNLIGRVLVAQAAAGSKAAEQANQLSIADSQLSIPGGIAKAVALKLVPDTAAEQAALRRWTSTADPVQRAQLLNARGAGVYDAIKADMQAMGIGSADKQDTKGVQQVAATYAAMTDEVRGAYFSSDQQQFYDRYNLSVRAGVPPEQAFLAARIAQPLARDVLPGDEKTEVHKAIRAEAERRNENFLGWNSVDDNSLRVIEAMIQRDYRTARGLNDTQTSVARALTTALQNGLEIVGKHAVVGKQPGQRDLAAVLATGENNMGAKEAASRFEEVLAAKVKAVGGNLNSYTIFRAPDVGGDPRYLIETIDKEGAIRTQTLTGTELRHYSKGAPPMTPGRQASGKIGLEQ